MWHSSEYTHTGKKRQINEDAVLNLNEQKFWMVADGMGGHSNGDYASSLIKRTFASYKRSRFAGQNNQALVSHLARCNQHLIEKARNEQAGIIGSTIAVLQAGTRCVKCTWSGDSRIYRLRNGILTQLTQDQSEQAAVENRDMIRQPEAMGASSQALTAAIGGDQLLSLEHGWYTLQTDDAYLLCTDGLNKGVSDEQIQRTMCECTSDDQVLDTLASLYHAGAAKDNVGMVYVHYLA